MSEDFGNAREGWGVKFEDSGVSSGEDGTRRWDCGFKGWRLWVFVWDSGFGISSRRVWILGS